MDCICGESIREVNAAKAGWLWVHDANGSARCPDRDGMAFPASAR